MTTLPWSGPKDAGWAFGVASIHRVQKALENHVGMRNRVTMKALSLEARVKGRPLRAILSEFDGLSFLLAYHRGSLYVAETAEQGREWTRHMQEQVRAQQARLERRKRYAQSMNPGQGTLFPGP